MQPNVPTALVVLTAEQLAALVTSAVQRALDRHVASQPPPAWLLKSSEMAERIGVCESQLGNLVRERCPCLVGDRQRRFEPERVMLWLRARGRT